MRNLVMRKLFSRIGIKFLRVILSLLFIILLIACGYVLFNTPITSSFETLSKKELKVYTKYLDTSLSSPREFVAQKFDHYDVVLLGEMHWKKQDVEFVNQLIPYLYHTKGVSVFGWEFGASDLQNEADILVNSPEFDRRGAISFLRRSSFARNHEEYLKIIHTIWETNSTIPEGHDKIRFLQLGSDYNPRKLYSPDPIIRQTERIRYQYDKKMGRIIEREVLGNKKKAVWYSGLHHAFTKYKQPTFLFKKSDSVRGGAYLFHRYPERIYMIQLSFPFPDRLTSFRILMPSIFGEDFKYVYPFRGLFEQIYREHKKPFAVDVKNSIFGDFLDTHSYYSMDLWGGLKLREMCDGYIVLCSIDEMEPVSLVPNWVTTEAELEEIRNILPPNDAANIEDIPDLMKYIETENQRSKMAEMKQLDK